MSNTWLQTSQQLYSFLLQLYPKNFRQEFGKEMQFVFSELLKDAQKEKGDQGVLTLCIRTLIDETKNLITQHIENQQGGLSMKTKSIVRVALVTASILLVPMIGMQLSDEWNWSPSDFIIIGALVAGTGFMIELVLHKVKNKNHRIAMAAGLILLCLYIWAELAVGIFTNLGS